MVSGQLIDFMKIPLPLFSVFETCVCEVLFLFPDYLRHDSAYRALM